LTVVQLGHTIKPPVSAGGYFNPTKESFVDLLERNIKSFWRKVAISAPEKCWEWTASLHRGGYGKFTYCTPHGRKTRPSHRISLHLATGVALNTPLLSLHSCDNKKCCNPAHLRWGTLSDNVKDAYARNDQWRAHRFKLLRQQNYRKLKLIPSQVDYILKLAAAGYTNHQLGRWYMVDPSAISRIKTGTHKAYQKMALGELVF
jgi:hypothetical protein